MAAAACTEVPNGLRGLMGDCPTPPGPPAGGKTGPAGALWEGSGGSQEERPSSVLRACLGGAGPVEMHMHVEDKDLTQKDLTQKDLIRDTYNHELQTAFEMHSPTMVCTGQQWAT